MSGTTGPPQGADVSAGDLQDLLGAVEEIFRAPDLAAIASIVRRAAQRMTGARGASFVLREGDNVYYVGEDTAAQLWEGRRFPVVECMAGWCILNREAAPIEDVYEAPRIPVEVYRPTFVKSLLMAPILHPAPIGALGLYWSERHRAPDREILLLKVLADVTGLAIRGVPGPGAGATRAEGEAVRRRPPMPWAAGGWPWWATTSRTRSTRSSSA